jgi:hypothetical protein
MVSMSRLDSEGKWGEDSGMFYALLLSMFSIPDPRVHGLRAGETWTILAPETLPAPPLARRRVIDAHTGRGTGRDLDGGDQWESSAPSD